MNVPRWSFFLFFSSPHSWPGTTTAVTEGRKGGFQATDRDRGGRETERKNVWPLSQGDWKALLLLLFFFLRSIWAAERLHQKKGDRERKSFPPPPFPQEHFLAWLDGLEPLVGEALLWIALTEREGREISSGDWHEERWRRTGRLWRWKENQVSITKERGKGSLTGRCLRSICRGHKNVWEEESAPLLMVKKKHFTFCPLCKTLMSHPGGWGLNSMIFPCFPPKQTIRFTWHLWKNAFLIFSDTKDNDGCIFCHL